MIKVAIIEDNEMYRNALCSILSLEDKITCIFALAECESMIGSFEVEKPDIVLMDIDLPGMNGIQAVWELKKCWPEIKVLMLTVFEDEEKIFGAIKAGANGYLIKKDNPQKILCAIEAVYIGESPMNGMIAAKLLDYFQKQGETINNLEESKLTPREKELLQGLVKGQSYKEIAGNAFISVETLNSHIKNIYRKLNVHSRSELAAKYGKAF